MSFIKKYIPIDYIQALRNKIKNIVTRRFTEEGTESHRENGRLLLCESLRHLCVPLRYRNLKLKTFQYSLSATTKSYEL